jgi:hypothetical protein
MRRGLRVAVLVLAASGFVIGAIGMSGGVSSMKAQPDRLMADPPQNIDLMTTTLMGQALANAADIPKSTWEPGKCDGWVEIKDGDPVGYCIPFGLTRSAAEEYRVGRLLRGHLPSDEQVATVSELITGTMASS